MRQIFAFFLTTLLLCLGVNQVWAETESVAYVLTDKLENGGEYLIVNTNALGDAVAMTHEGATIKNDGVTISAGIASSGNQPYILDDTKTVEQFIKEAIAKTGENITVRQFKRIELGVTE